MKSSRWKGRKVVYIIGVLVSLMTSGLIAMSRTIPAIGGEWLIGFFVVGILFAYYDYSLTEKEDKSDEQQR